jgi:hypothetical protein
MRHEGCDRIRLVMGGRDPLWPAVGPPAAVQIVDPEDAVLRRVDTKARANGLLPPARRAIRGRRGDVPGGGDPAENDDQRSVLRTCELVSQQCRHSAFSRSGVRGCPNVREE